MNPGQLALTLKNRAHQLGFTLVGITLPGTPAHFDVYRLWLDAGRQAGMTYLADERAIERRADPSLILPECRSILVLGTPYSNPKTALPLNTCPERSSGEPSVRGRVAAYAWGADYHLVLPERLRALVNFIEA